METGISFARSYCLTVLAIESIKYSSKEVFRVNLCRIGVKMNLTSELN